MVKEGLWRVLALEATDLQRGPNLVGRFLPSLPRVRDDFPCDSARQFYVIVLRI